MTLQDYLTQPVKRRPKFSVQLKRSDCYNIQKVIGGEIVTLQLTLENKTMFYNYFVPSGDTALYTMTEDGNKKALSVFKF